jgi:hypothetical protein
MSSVLTEVNRTSKIRCIWIPRDNVMSPGRCHLQGALGVPLSRHVCEVFGADPIVPVFGRGLGGRHPQAVAQKFHGLPEGLESVRAHADPV